MFLVAATNPPDRCPTVLLLFNHFLDTLASSNRQENASPFHLKPGPGPASGDLFQNGAIWGFKGKFTRFSTTHTIASNAGTEISPLHCRHQFVS
jgi:hypothetical protein